MSTVTLAEGRFEISVDEQVAGFAQFLDREGRRIFFHTEIGEAYAGQGLGGVLAREAVGQTVDAGLTVVPVCPFIKTWVQKHPEHAEHVQMPIPADLQALAGQAH